VCCFGFLAWCIKKRKEKLDKLCASFDNRPVYTHQTHTAAVQQQQQPKEIKVNTTTPKDKMRVYKK
jgi:hypothetical protein